MALIDQLRTRRAELLERVDAIRATAAGEARDLTDAELEQIAQVRRDFDALDARIVELTNQRTRMEATVTADNSDNPRRERSTASVINEPRTYSREAERRGVSFTADVIRGTLRNDFEARDRLAAHMREARAEGETRGIEQRAVGTGAFAGLTVPQYLVDLAAPLARAARPFADICRRLDLPAEGMTVNLSRITTGTSVGAQEAEGDAVSETDADDTQLVVPVRTIAGMQDVSLQAVERAGADEVLVQDLISAYAAELDRQLIHGPGSAGTHLGVQATAGVVEVAYTDASPTPQELYPQIANLVSQIQAGVFAGVTHLVMHPRRWWWISSVLGTEFSLVHHGAIQTVQAGEGKGTQYEATHSLMGIPVVLDGGISITQGAGAEDSLLGVTQSECFLWERPSDPLLIRADQAVAANLQARLVVYGYSAFTAGRRPAANGRILGTGMTTPAFS